MPKNDQELVDAIVDREHEKAHKIPLVVGKIDQLTEDTITSKLPEKPELIMFENKDRIVQLEQQLANVTDKAVQLRKAVCSYNKHLKAETGQGWSKLQQLLADTEELEVK